MPPDNSVLASHKFPAIVDEMGSFGFEVGAKLNRVVKGRKLRYVRHVDFNQGLDARLLTPGVVMAMRKIEVPVVRLAYDSNAIREPLKKAIELLLANGYNGRRIVVYCLYNHTDKPDDFHARVRDLIDWGVVAYPMRYEPLEPKPKNTYVGPEWTAPQLEMVALARRVIGYGGAFPPYEGLRKKLDRAHSFDRAFHVRKR